MSPKGSNTQDSDSDDPEYVPTNQRSSSDEGSARLKCTRLAESPDNGFQGDAESRKEARDKAWSSFQTALAAPPPRPDSQSKKTVKIQKRHRFAGEDVTEIVEVAEDSEDARKWPHWNAVADLATATAPTPSGKIALADSPTPTAPVATAKRKRKSRIQLDDISSSSAQRAKKITTLEKSALDWRSHVDSQPDPHLKDELDVNRRGGGYLDRVQFLDNVGERRDRLLEDSKDRKRRRV